MVKSASISFNRANIGNQRGLSNKAANHHAWRVHSSTLSCLAAAFGVGICALAEI